MMQRTAVTCVLPADVSIQTVHTQGLLTRVRGVFWASMVFTYTAILQQVRFNDTVCIFICHLQRVRYSLNKHLLCARHCAVDGQWWLRDRTLDAWRECTCVNTDNDHAMCECYHCHTMDWRHRKGSICTQGRSTFQEEWRNMYQSTET